MSITMIFSADADEEGITLAAEPVGYFGASIFGFSSREQYWTSSDDIAAAFSIRFGCLGRRFYRLPTYRLLYFRYYYCWRAAIKTMMHY